MSDLLVGDTMSLFKAFEIMLDQNAWSIQHVYTDKTCSDELVHSKAVRHCSNMVRTTPCMLPHWCHAPKAGKLKAVVLAGKETVWFNTGLQDMMFEIVFFLIAYLHYRLWASSQNLMAFYVVWLEIDSRERFGCPGLASVWIKMASKQQTTNDPTQRFLATPMRRHVKFTTWSTVDAPGNLLLQPTSTIFVSTTLMERSSWTSSIWFHKSAITRFSKIDSQQAKRETASWQWM